MMWGIEPISLKSFSRFSGSFDPIFKGGNILNVDITPNN